MTLTAKDVEEIIRLLDQSSFDELALEIGDLKLSLRRSAAGGFEPAPAGGAGTLELEPDVAVAESAAADGDAPDRSGKSPAPASDPTLRDVTSPLLGIFYRSPKPGAPPFVEVGQTVEDGTVIGIIEVMKLMNSVRSDVGGEVVEIVPANGALVEYGETLIRVRPA